MRRWWVVALAAGTALGLAGCTDAGTATITSLGHQFDVVCYSGGKEVLRDVSSGQVQSEEHGSGHYYRSTKTGGLVLILGNCVSSERSE